MWTDIALWIILCIVLMTLGAVVSYLWFKELRKAEIRGWNNGYDQARREAEMEFGQKSQFSIPSTNSYRRK